MGPRGRSYSGLRQSHEHFASTIVGCFCGPGAQKSRWRRAADFLGKIKLESPPISFRAFLMIMSKAVSHLCFMLIAAILARSLQPTEFGTFNQVWMLNRTMIYLFALGLPVSVYYFLPRLPEARMKCFVLQTMLGLTILGIPFSAGMYAFVDSLA